MTNKYTLKYPYEWHINRSTAHCNDMELSIRYSSGEHTVISASLTIRSPKASNAQIEIVFAMVQIKEERPELFEDYNNITDTFDKALKEIETLNDIQLAEAMLKYTVTTSTARD